VKAPADTKVLLVTPLDFASMPNNSEHNRAAQYRDRGYSVTVLHKTMNSSSDLASMLRDSLSFRVGVTHRDGLRLVAVDPFFNYCAGYGRSFEAKSVAAGKRRRSPKLILVRLLSPMSVLRDLFFLPCMLAAARWKIRERFDICLGVGPWGGAVGWALRAMGKVSTLVYIDRDYEAGLVPDPIRRSYTRAVEEFGIRRADVWVCVGHLLAERRRQAVDREAHIIPTGVDWDLYESSRQKTESGRRLLYIGNVNSWCGVEIAMRALPIIRREYPDTTLRVVGGGLADYLEFLRKLADELGVAGSVELLGERPHAELEVHLRESDVGLANSEPVPFRRYACPIKVMEYMAAGLPVIATEETEAADIVSRLRCGAAASYDVESFAVVVAGLFRDPEAMRAMRRNGIERSRERTWSAAIDRELELIAASRSDMATDDRATASP
jgi:glycosyltransferase involved in cell wall biosynthesis